MQLDHDRFMEDGFLILPGFVGPEELDQLRIGFDILVQLSQEQSRKNRKPDQPLGGDWHGGGQPRVIVDRVVTSQTAYVAEYYLGKSMEVSTELLQTGRAGLGQLQLMASSILDYGATDWHRDYDSNTLAPLGGVQQDLAINGPPYVQWNIALYDDDVLWVVPGSHKNPDSEELKEALLKDPQVEVPGGFQARLKAGDAIVYASYILHWGSVYSSRMRRVVHHGYYDFDKISSFGHHPHYDLELGFTRHLSPEARARFEQQRTWTIECRDLYESVFRIALEKDGEAFTRQLAQLHPEESCRLVSVAHFCHLAEKIQRVCGSQASQLSAAQRSAAEAGYGEHFWSDFKGRFSAPEADDLGQRFALMTERMAADREAVHVHYAEVYRKLVGADGDAAENGGPNFFSRPLRTHYHEMPDMTIEELIASW